MKQPSGDGKAHRRKDEVKMRLWHKDLISVLPRQQLLSQWRECCAIASNIANKGSPNHGLVNKLMHYSINHFKAYTKLVNNEMNKRGYKINSKAYNNFQNNLLLTVENGYMVDSGLEINIEHIFFGWHNDKYLKQCYYNLEEKFDYSLISEGEFQGIYFKAKEMGVI